MWSNQKSPTLMEGIQIGTTTFESKLAQTTNAKCIHTL